MHKQEFLLLLYLLNMHETYPFMICKRFFFVSFQTFEILSPVLMYGFTTHRDHAIVPGEPSKMFGKYTNSLCRDKMIL